MITSDFLDFDSYPSLVVNQPFCVTAPDKNPDTVAILAAFFQNASISHQQDGSRFTIREQKITLDADHLVALLAILHDDAVAVNPSVKLVHYGARRMELAAGNQQ